MCRHRLSRPYRTAFLRGGVTDSENEIQVRCAGFSKLAPTLTSLSSGGESYGFDLAECCRVNCALWMASSTVRLEIGKSFLVHDGFCHNRTSGVSLAEEQNVVSGRHLSLCDLYIRA